MVKSSASHISKKQKTAIILFLLMSSIILIIILSKNQKTRETILKLEYNDKVYLVNISKKTAEQYFHDGTKYKSEQLPEQLSFNNGIFVSIYYNGDLIGSGYSKKSNIANSVIEATYSMLQNGEKSVKITESDLNNITTVINIISNMQELTVKDIVILNKQLSIGLDGLTIQRYDKNITLPPQIAIENDWNTVKLLQNTCSSAALGINCWNGPDSKLYKYESINFLGNDNGVFELYRSVPLLSQNLITKDKILNSITAASNWQIKVQKNDSSYEYFFNPSSNYHSLDNNLIRQAHSAYAITRAYGLTHNKNYLDSAHKNINFILSYMEQNGNSAHLSFNGNSIIGQDAVTLMAMLESPYDKKYEQEINLFGNFLLSMQREDGSFMTSYNSTKDDFDYYPGETLLAFARLYRKTKDIRYLNAVEKAFPFYRNYFHTTKHQAFVMWQTSAFFEMYELTEKKEYADFVFEMTDWIVSQQYDEKNSPYADFTGGFATEDEVPTLSASVYSEGTADAYKLAKELNDPKRIHLYGKSLKLASRFIIQLQFDDTNTYYIKQKEIAAGAIKQSLVSNNVRIDYSAHSISALLKIYGIFDEIKDL